MLRWNTHKHTQPIQEFNRQKVIIELDLMKWKALSASGKGRASFIHNHIYWQRKSWVTRSLKHENDFSQSAELRITWIEIDALVCIDSFLAFQMLWSFATKGRCDFHKWNKLVQFYNFQNINHYGYLWNIPHVGNATNHLNSQSESPDLPLFLKCHCFHTWEVFLPFFNSMGIWYHSSDLIV